MAITEREPPGKWYKEVCDPYNVTTDDTHIIFALKQLMSRTLSLSLTCLVCTSRESLPFGFLLFEMTVECAMNTVGKLTAWKPIFRTLSC